jgi:hypothetical protein
MRIRPTSCSRPVLVAGLLVCLLPAPEDSRAEAVQALSMPRARGASALRSSDASDPDTVWIGHVQNPTGLPGTPGGYGPYRIGRGTRLRGGGAAGFPNGVWTFDHFQGGTDVDSLQGWWPVALPYRRLAGGNLNDRDRRPFFGFDYGNNGNYVIPQGAPKRTFGVTGYWHRDPGANAPGLPDTGAVIAGPGVEWLPLGGGFSAWCGLRGHGDATVVDDPALGGTGNAFNQSVLEYQGGYNSTLHFGSSSPTGTDRNFPGYGSQWDQMLYRDVVLADGQGFDLSFAFRTELSTGRDNSSVTRVGWFDKDPVKRASLNDGNFISSSDAGGNAPIDSFMVYVGVPVEPVAGDDNDFRCTDPVAGGNGDGMLEIFDVQRRWFSEVIAIDRPYRELMSTFGINPAQMKSIVLPGGPGSAIQQILDAQPGAGGLVRVLFRVKTNRGWDDEDHSLSTFSSRTSGAALVDDVNVNGWNPTKGDFEAPESIDNRPQVTALDAWKSTGKPPQAFFHSVALAGLPFNDPCGEISSQRLCNMEGRVVHAGDADQNESLADPINSNARDRQRVLVSPTINLRSNGPGDYNGMGIDAEIADALADIVLDLDLHTAAFQFATGATRNGIRVGWQSYPAGQANGLPVWGEMRRTISFRTYDGTLGCFNSSTEGASFAPVGSFARREGLIQTTNASGVPDSIRVYIEHLSTCYSSVFECGAQGPFWSGGYIDNLSIGFIDGPGHPTATVEPWDLFHDVFPTNEAILPATPSFDTLAALVRSGRNIAEPPGFEPTPLIPGDTALVTSAGDDVRIDLVFRILPGVGNYRTVGNRASGLRKRPDQGGAAGNAVIAGDGSFWGEYLADNGTFGSPGGHGGGWSEHAWNSARMDTAEINLFPCDGAHGNELVTRLTPGLYATQYHEADPRFAVLGTIKNRCFLQNDAFGASLIADNINCGNGTLGNPGAPYPPPWTASSASGFDPNEVPGQPGRTREHTKIIPDGQLTPGAHVQYFFRKSRASAPALATETLPDTHFVWPQRGEGSLDGHRWQQFGVLPDRWKAAEFGGQGMACMLFVDVADRRGDELEWVAFADSVGYTALSRRGAHNGWRARGDQPIATPAGGPIDVSGDPSIARYTHGGQPGTVWDLYQVKGGEAAPFAAGLLGSRGASVPVPGLADGKLSKLGPSEAMLLTFYRVLLVATNDTYYGLGPNEYTSSDDIGLLTEFVTNAVYNPRPRGLLMFGQALAEDFDFNHPSFLNNVLGVRLREPDYRRFSANAMNVVDLETQPPLGFVGSRYGIANDCLDYLDVLDLAPGAIATPVMHYQNVGGQGPYIAAVYKPSQPNHEALTLIGGFALSQPVGSRFTLTKTGTKTFWCNVLNTLFAGVFCGPNCVVTGVGDGPGDVLAPFARLRSANPARGGTVRIAFALPVTERALVRVYDVSGRTVRTIANRIFEGGREHEVVWDGADDAGRRAPSGVYFYRLHAPSFTSERKVTLLRD